MYCEKMGFAIGSRKLHLPRLPLSMPLGTGISDEERVNGQLGWIKVSGEMLGSKSTRVELEQLSEPKRSSALGIKLDGGSDQT